MPYNIITTLGGLFGFLRRYGGILDEIIEEIRGFTTTTPGATNVVFSKIRPKRKPKIIPYKTEEFIIPILLPLTVICDKERSRKFRLQINCAQIPLFYNDNLQIRQDIGVSGITSLAVNKECLTKEKLQKLHTSLIITGYNSETININTNLYSRNYTPISVKLWIKRNLTSKLGVFIPAKDKIRTRVSNGSYLYDDVGSISEIEMLDIIKDVEMINAIRH